MEARASQHTPRLVNIRRITFHIATRYRSLSLTIKGQQHIPSPGIGHCCKRSFPPASPAHFRVPREKEPPHPSLSVSHRAPHPRDGVISYLPALYVLHDLLLSLERRLLPPVRVAVPLSQQQGNKMNPRPRLFPLELSATTAVSISLPSFFCRGPSARRLDDKKRGKRQRAAGS